MFEPKFIILTNEEYEKLLWYYDDYNDMRKGFDEHKGRQMNSFLNQFADAIFEHGLVDVYDFRLIFFEMLERYPNIARKFADRSHGIYRGGYSKGGVHL